MRHLGHSLCCPHLTMVMVILEGHQQHFFQSKANFLLSDLKLK